LGKLKDFQGVGEIKGFERTGRQKFSGARPDTTKAWEALKESSGGGG